MSNDSVRELIIDASSPDISIALLENKELVELTREKTSVKFAVGDIYLGKVKKVMPGLNAAFVDIGYEKDAFLHYLDLGPQFNSLSKYLHIALAKKSRLPAVQKFKRERDINKDGKISDVLQAGQNVLVQIVKEPISTKGPRLSSEIAIAGRNLVLTPFSDKVSVSSRIESVGERNRLKRLLLSIKPRNYGLIVRTVGESKKVATFDSELRTLVRRWEQAFQNLQGTKPPKVVISELNRTEAMLRDILNVTFHSVHVNDATIFGELKEYIGSIAPEKEKIVKLYKDNVPIFEQFGINKQIKSLFGRTVSFKNGAYLIIEHTEALHVIDINSGTQSKKVTDQASNALEVNLAAAGEIARQLRLRDMGGIIVIDFIDMVSQEHRQRVFDRMKEAMSEDRAKHNILPLSKFCLMQITRQRVRPELNIDVSESCPTCKGSGKISPSIMFTDELKEKIRSAIEEYKLGRITVHVHPYIEAYLNRGFYSPAKKWSRDLKCKLDFRPMTSFHLTESRLFTAGGDEIPV